jgi:hypothetical protein
VYDLPKERYPRVSVRWSPESRHSRQGSLSYVQQISHTRVADQLAGHALRQGVHNPLLVPGRTVRLEDWDVQSDEGVATKAREIRVEDPEAVAIHIQLTSIFLHPQGPFRPFYSLFDQFCCNHGGTDPRVHVTLLTTY